MSARSSTTRSNGYRNFMAGTPMGRETTSSCSLLQVSHAAQGRVLIPSMRCRSRVVIVLSLTTPTLQRLADHPLPPHLSLADRLSLSNHSLIAQHRPRRRPYASWSSNDLRLPHHPILPILNSFRQRLPFRTLQQLPYHTILHSSYGHPPLQRLQLPRCSPNECQYFPYSK